MPGRPLGAGLKKHIRRHRRQGSRADWSFIHHATYFLVSSPHPRHNTSIFVQTGATRRPDLSRRLSRTIRPPAKEPDNGGPRIAKLTEKGNAAVNKDRPAQRTRRLNLRSLTILGVIVLIAIPSLFVIKTIQDRTGRKAFLNEAKARLKDDQPALALGYINRYLELSPDDVEALALKAKILADGARNGTQALDAVQALNQVLGRSSEGPEKQDVRRRLARLNLELRRPRAAESQARELIQKGAEGEAEAHRLLAHALEAIGETEKKTGAIEEARKEYETAESIEPGDVPGVVNLADLYRDRLEQPAKAGEVLDRLVARTAADPKKHASALLARARHATLLRLTAKPDELPGLNARAEADVLKAVNDDPSDRKVRLAAAEIALRRRDTAAARHHLAAIVESQRGHIEVKVVEGVIDMADSRPDDAIQIWRSGLLQTGGSDSDLTWRLANILLETGRIAEAQPLIDQYHRLVGDAVPDVYGYHYLRGVSLLRTNRPIDAVAELEPIRYKVDKRLEAFVYHALGMAYEAARDLPHALDAFQKAADLSKDWSAPWTALARIQALNSPEEAIATLRKGLTLNPDDPRMLTSLAHVLWRRQMRKAQSERSWTEVEQILVEARKRTPGSVELALAEADFYAATNRVDDAFALLKTATSLNPKSPEAWLARVNLLTRRKHLAEALDTLDQALKAAGPQAAFFINRAGILMIKGQNADARQALVEGLERVPAEQRPILWKNLGEFYQNQKDLTSARAAFDEWAKLQPTNPEPRISLFMLALASGDDRRIALAVDDVQAAAGPRGYYGKHVRIEDLLRTRSNEPDDPKRDAQRLVEAEALAQEIVRDEPQLPVGYLLQARVRERRKQVPEAIAAYRRALKLNAGALALDPLVDLLVRENRQPELDEIRKEYDDAPIQLDRLATLQALRAGNKDRAEQLTAQAVRGDSQALDLRVWQAEVLKALGNPKEAEAGLRRLIAAHPHEASPRLQLLMLQLSQDQKPEAAATVEQITRQVTGLNNPELLWVQCYRAIGNPRRAYESYQQALARSPNDVNILTSAIAFFESINLRDEAEKGLRALRGLDPSNTWAARKLALSLAARPGNRASWEEAASLVGPDRRPDDVPDDLVTRAGVYSHGATRADRDKAIAILESLVAEMPNQAKIREQLARLLFSANEIPRARDHAAKAAEGSDASSEAILLYAGVLLAQKDIAAAETQLDRLNASSPDSLPVAEIKARVLAAQGKPEEGAKALEIAFNNRAKTPEALSVGEKMLPLLISIHQPEAAGRVSQTLAALGPRGKLARAEFLDGQGRTDDALALVNETAKAGDSPLAANTALSLAAKPTADPRWLPLADSLLAIDKSTSIDHLQKIALLRHLERRHPQEIEAYRQILAAKPSNYQFLNNMAWTLSEEMAQPAEGLNWIDQALKLAGPDPHILDTRGVILARLGKLDQAIEALQAAAAENNDPAAYYHLARAYQKAGKPEETRKAVARVRSLGLTRDQLQPSEQADWDALMKP